MLKLYRSRTSHGEPPADLGGGGLPSDAVWIDLIRPEPEEIAYIQRTTGLDVPSSDELSEIESSSRLRNDDGALYLSMPLATRGRDSDQPVPTPVGFVLTRERLITVRFEELVPFTHFIDHDLAAETDPLSSAAVFAGLTDAISDRLADVLENIAAELDTLSHRLFRSPATEPAGRKPPARETADLRIILRRIGHSGDLASKIRDSLLGIGRIVPYVTGLAAWLPPEVKPRLDTVVQDVRSLSDYDAHIVNKVQLLLDATLGLINIEQNNIMKVLTVVSVVGIPPTLIASMYGMNFKDMPELGWSWGYPYGLAMIVLSAILPICWFKWRGWL